MVLVRITTLIGVVLVGSCFSLVSSYDLGAGDDAMPTRGRWGGFPNIPPFLRVPGLLNPGYCPDVPSLPLDSTSFQMIMGTWYATGWTLPGFFNLAVQCPTAVLTMNTDNVARIDASVILFSSRRMNATVGAGINWNGDMELRIPVPGGSARGLPLKIIGTDREEYAVLYTCVQLNSFYIDAAVLASRDPKGDRYLEEAKTNLKMAGLQGKTIAPIRCG